MNVLKTEWRGHTLVAWHDGPESDPRMVSPLELHYPDQDDRLILEANDHELRTRVNEALLDEMAAAADDDTRLATVDALQAELELLERIVDEKEQIIVGLVAELTRGRDAAQEPRRG